MVELTRDKICVLVDNGSIRAHAPLYTRKLAKALEHELGMTVIACSVAHSDEILLESLQGKAVPLLESLLELLSGDENIKEILVIPFVLVTKGAIYRKTFSILQCFMKLYPRIEYKIAEGLFSGNDPNDCSIAGMLTEGVKSVLAKEKLERPRVILVDHGSPFTESSKVRNYLANRLEVMLGSCVESVVASSMERRSGEQYDFNEPLLKRALTASINQGHETVLIARLFLQPGKHSGRDGDIDRICNRSQKAHTQLKIFNLPRVFPQKRLIQLLARRLYQLNISEENLS